MLVLLPWLSVIISVVIIIPFITLLERKVLSYIQTRRGPKKVRFIGILQPISDGLKLVLKSMIINSRVKSFIFGLSPIFKFFIMLILFAIFVPYFPRFSFNLGIIFYLCFSSLLVYSIMTSGWSSNSKFSFLGRLRGGAQIVSYEISLLTLIFFPCITSKRFNIGLIKRSFSYKWLVFFIVFFFWLISIVAETNRSPFDFAEGERELVSGFNTEYRAMAFALLFLGEYGKIIFVRFFSSFLFFSKKFFFKVTDRKSVV